MRQNEMKRETFERICRQWVKVVYHSRSYTHTRCKFNTIEKQKQHCPVRVYNQFVMVRKLAMKIMYSLTLPGGKKEIGLSAERVFQFRAPQRCCAKQGISSPFMWVLLPLHPLFSFLDRTLVPAPEKSYDLEFHAHIHESQRRATLLFLLNICCSCWTNTPNHR